ncbi:hypothetical protein F4820DRAFT_433478 [Hypoxylon rubiginosum]|uniref:Uncharacterized protein n=1 Tax=Hypoxylon rubiginosum TaxID=110542 RepID=A0ACB9YQM3_9PEZI|nr:hypothetical protein F4820DRAFT_433478 [Hypoxylon rubiginosum]
MHPFTYLVLSFLGIALSLPLFRAEHKRDSILTLSPTIDPGLNLSNDNSCLGIGISVCDPITVNSTTTEATTKPKAKAASGSSSSSTTQDDATPTSGDTLINTTGASGDSLINISPTISPDLSLSNDNGCLGIGISACDPITVGSDVTKTVTEESDDSTADDSSDAPSSTYPTSAPSATSTSKAGDSLLDLSPNASPDLNLSNDNGCLGIGISVCDPITVDSIVNKTVSG